MGKYEQSHYIRKLSICQLLTQSENTGVLMVLEARDAKQPFLTEELLGTALHGMSTWGLQNTSVQHHIQKTERTS